MDLLVKCAYMQTKCIDKLKIIIIYTKSKSVNIRMPQSLKIIGDFVFIGSKNLKNVTIGSSLEYLGSYAFTELYELTITVNDNIHMDKWSPLWNASNIKVIIK